MIEKRRGDTISAPRIWSFAQQSSGAGAAADLPVSDGRSRANRRNRRRGEQERQVLVRVLRLRTCGEE